MNSDVGSHGIYDCVVKMDIDVRSSLKINCLVVTI